MAKLLEMAQNIKKKTSANHVSKLHGLVRLTGRSLGESEFRSQYNIRVFVESIVFINTESITSSNFVFVNNPPYFRT
jgi:hypothetical protein